jgi:putative inorganic carbon (hco3(-)) transporter
VRTDRRTDPRSPLERPSRRVLLVGALVAVSSSVAGVAAAMAGVRLGPWAALAVFALPLVAALALREPAVGVVAFIASLPIGFVALGPLQVVEVAALLCIGAVVLSRLLAARPLLVRMGPLGWALALVALVIMSYTRTIDPNASFRAVMQMLGGVGLAWAVAVAVESRAQLRSITAALLAVGTVVSLQAVLTAEEQSTAYGGAVVTGRAHGVFAQPNEMGLFAAMLLVIAVATGIGAADRRWRVAALVAGTALAGALLLSLSRGAWLGASAGVLALAVLLPAARRRLLSVGVPALLLGAVLVVQVPDNPQVTVIGDRLESLAAPDANPYDDRPAIYREAVRQTVESPLTGQGPGAFPTASARWSAADQTVFAEHAHNALLTMAAENGLPAAVLLVSLAAAVASAAWRAVGLALADGRRGDAALYAGATASLAALAAHSSIDYPLRNAVLFLLAWAVTGLLVAAARMEGAVGVRAPRRGPTRDVPSVVHP